MYKTVVMIILALVVGMVGIIKTPPSAEAEAEGVMDLCGDANGSGHPDVADVILVLKRIVGLAEIDRLQALTMDVSGDGTIDLRDGIMLLQHLVGYIEITSCGNQMSVEEWQAMLVGQALQELTVIVSSANSTPSPAEQAWAWNLWATREILAGDTHWDFFSQGTGRSLAIDDIIVVDQRGVGQVIDDEKPPPEEENPHCPIDFITLWAESGPVYVTIICDIEDDNQRNFVDQVFNPIYLRLLIEESMPAPVKTGIWLAKYVWFWAN